MRGLYARATSRDARAAAWAAARASPGKVSNLESSHKPPSMWRPWRGLAAPELVEKRKTIVPEHDNYDGRNYITE